MVAVHSYRLDNLDKQVGELCTMLRDVLERLPEKYQTKEMCKSCKENKAIQMEAQQEEIVEIKRSQGKFTWGMICALAYVAWDMAKPLLHIATK